LPAWAAQRRLSPINIHYHPPTPPDAIPAGVTMLLQPKPNNILALTYIKRGSKYGKDLHKGQISFPGGKKEDTDIDMLDCALRETEEELGIDRKDINILGQLSTFNVFVSGFVVSPYVGWIAEDILFEPDVDEVAEVIQIDIETLFSPSNLQYRSYDFRGSTIDASPYYLLGPELLWGATAMMTAELQWLIEEVKGKQITKLA
jgi:8-oxo-dGTP pyrophosphatase MutT (NUDIX family)